MWHIVSVPRGDRHAIKQMDHLHASEMATKSIVLVHRDPILVTKGFNHKLQYDIPISGISEALGSWKIERGITYRFLLKLLGVVHIPDGDPIKLYCWDYILQSGCTSR